MADDIRTLSALLARDPASLAYVELAEALRRQGQLNEAAQVVMQGLARHPQHADGYDALARIHSDRGDLGQARAAWERALTIAPEHLGALKGIGFVCWRLGEMGRAREALEHAALVNPDDEGLRRALEAVGLPMPPAPAPAQPEPVAAAAHVSDLAAVFAAPPRPATPAATTGEGRRPPVFAGFEGATVDILLLDSRGLVVAGGLTDSKGDDVSELAAAALAGVSGEASRTASYLGLGDWAVIVAEAETANVVLAPAADGALLMMRRERSTPVGLALRIAERARGVAMRWLEGQGA